MFTYFAVMDGCNENICLLQYFQQYIYKSKINYIMVIHMLACLATCCITQMLVVEILGRFGDSQPFHQSFICHQLLS